VLKRFLERVAAEISELVEADAAAPAKRRMALGVLLAAPLAKAQGHRSVAVQVARLCTAAVHRSVSFPFVFID
jgi:hypothetical protein